MGEVHIIGQIIGALDFPKQSLLCKWRLQTGNGWKVISGNTEGQTQIDSPLFENRCYWNFPIDVHLVTKGIQGWPKIYIQVFHFDSYGRYHLFGYGFLNVPTTPGDHRLNCHTWRPVGSLYQRFVQFFLGGSPQLKQPDIVFTVNDRYKLNTESMGIVDFELGIILRNFEKFGVEYK